MYALRYCESAAVVVLDLTLITAILTSGPSGGRIAGSSVKGVISLHES
jgi:hypothetical protein